MNPHYINTDLILLSDHDTASLATHLDKKCELLYCRQDENETWHLCVEAEGSGMYDDSDSSPERDIDLLLSVLDALEGPHRDLLSTCRSVDFNIGWIAPERRPQREFSLSAGLLQRIAAFNASLTVTVYPSSDLDE